MQTLARAGLLFCRPKLAGTALAFTRAGGLSTPERRLLVVVTGPLENTQQAVAWEGALRHARTIYHLGSARPPGRPYYAIAEGPGGVIASQARRSWTIAMFCCVRCSLSGALYQCACACEERSVQQPMPPLQEQRVRPHFIPRVRASMVHDEAPPALAGLT